MEFPEGKATIGASKTERNELTIASLTPKKCNRTEINVMAKEHKLGGQAVLKIYSPFYIIDPNFILRCFNYNYNILSSSCFC